MRTLTVIMPVYNGEKYLEEAIESILNQSFTDFKLLVLDDNSSDSTPKILKAYQDKDSRVVVITKSKNIGPAKLRNEGFEIAQTEFIALMDADDIAMPTRFEKQLQVFRQHPEVGLCGSWFTIFGNKKEKIIKHSSTHEALRVHFLSSCGIGNSTVMLRKAALGDFRFDSDFIVAEDYELWSKFIHHTTFYNIQESLVRYRWHQTNISQTRKQHEKDAERIIKKRQLQRFGIDFKESNLEAYINAVSLQRNLSPEHVKLAIEASKDLKERNRKTEYYDLNIFEKHINKVIIRTIRNASAFNKDFYAYIKRESGYFQYIPFIDKVILFFKSLV